MTKDKDLKRRVRARMQKTGEAYTTARSHIVRKRTAHHSTEPTQPGSQEAEPQAAEPRLVASERTAGQPAEPAGAGVSRAGSPAAKSLGASLPDGYEALAGQTDATVAAKTGRTWPEWVAALDAAGATKMDHRAIAGWVYDACGVGWWSQMVAVGYERIRGLRDVGQRRGGAYEAGKSRTFAVPAASVFDAFADDDVRRRWLDADLTIRKATPHKSLRITWGDGSNVEVYLTAKGPSKTTVSIAHGKLASKQAAEEAKAFWADRFDALAKLLK
jgi:uncharacterized protein YndB with AHSA1/START domain